MSFMLNFTFTVFGLLFVIVGFIMACAIVLGVIFAIVFSIIQIGIWICEWTENLFVH